jgi:hypothetical protein
MAAIPKDQATMIGFDARPRRSLGRGRTLVVEFIEEVQGGVAVLS